jgi:PAS domain S-box-containing protein
LNAEERLERLAALVGCSEDAIVATDTEGLITDWNAGAERLFGYASKEVTGRSNLLLVPPDDMAIRQSGSLTTFGKGKSFNHTRPYA